MSNPAGPFFGSNVAVPRVKQPFTNQYSVGWSHELTPSTVIDVDYVHVEGKDLGVRWQLNTITPAGTRRYASLGFSPANPTMNMGIGASKFDGFNIGMRRRMSNNWQLNGWYQWSSARGLGGLGLDELTTNLVQDATDPLNDVQWGPSARTDARHKVIDQRRDPVAMGHLRVADLPLPIGAAAPHLDRVRRECRRDQQRHLPDRVLVHRDRRRRERPVRRRLGACENINCGRGAALTQFNLRVSKVFKLPHGMNIEAIGEVFNLFNAINPNFGVGAASSSRYYMGTAASHSPNTVFMKPTAYSGDSGQPEQRVGQIGFRFTF